MKKAIFPGSFDPVTKGHIDMIKRAVKLFDEVIVVILNNSEKHCLFTLEERLALLKHATAEIDHVYCTSDDGLTVSYASLQGACAIIRGVRNIKDYEYELEIASINRHIDDSIETVILLADTKYSYISSSMIREMIKYKQDIHDFVSEEVYQALKVKYERNS